jgi:hypothetical protein
VLLRPLEEGSANVVYGVRPDRPERGTRFFLGAKLLTHLTNFLFFSTAGRFMTKLLATKFSAALC